MEVVYSLRDYFTTLLFYYVAKIAKIAKNTIINFTRSLITPEVSPGFFSPLVYVFRIT